MEISNQAELSEQQSDKTEVLIAFISLLIANIAMSSAPIFIVLSEEELSSTATIFNRLWIAALVLGLWKGTQARYSRLFKKPTPKLKTYTRQDLGLLLAVGITYPLNQMIWAWSMTQTSVAILGTGKNCAFFEKLRKISQCVKPSGPLRVRGACRRLYAPRVPDGFAEALARVPKHSNFCHKSRLDRQLKTQFLTV